LFHSTPHNDSELLALIARGDEAAFAKLFKQYRDRIYTIAVKLTKSTIIAEEIVQDIFLKIWIRRADLSRIQNLEAYLFVVARNDVYKVLKGIARNHRPTSLDAEEPVLSDRDAADLLIEKEYDALLRNAINRLPTQQKQVYQLVKDRGLKREEVAQELQIQPETVKFHLAQAMKNIRAFCLLRLGTDIGFFILFLRLLKNL
jgi:RNA polymerase sigma-70 factor (ECF subfamily)